MRSYLLDLSGFATCLCLAVACNKSSSPAQNMVVGTWEIRSVATDSNHNNIADSNEMWNGFYLANNLTTFSANGTGYTGAYLGGTIPFVWALAQNSTYINILYSGTSRVQDLRILTINSATLILKDTANQNYLGGPLIETYVKH